MIKLDFTKYPAAQDMIKIIEKERELSTSDAITYAITSERAAQIMQTGWADIAVSQWDHGNPNREWNIMNSPIIDINLEEGKLSILNLIKKKTKKNTETVISYFLIFTMESLGHHI